MIKRTVQLVNKGNLCSICLFGITVLRYKQMFKGTKFGFVKLQSYLLKNDEQYSSSKDQNWLVDPRSFSSLTRYSKTRLENLHFGPNDER